MDSSPEGVSNVHRIKLLVFHHHCLFVTQSPPPNVTILAHLDDSKPQFVSNLSTHNYNFVPSSSDYKRLHSDFIVLASHIVVAELSAFQFMSEAVPDHILHQYSREMAQ